MSRQATSGWAIFRRLLQEQRGFLPHIGLLLALQVIAAPVMLLGPLGIKVAVDSYIGDAPLPRVLDALVPATLARSPEGALWVAIALVLAVAVLGQALGTAAGLLRVYTQERLVLRFRDRLFPHVAKLSLAYHEGKGSVDSTYRIIYDTAMLPSILLDGIIPFVSAAALLGMMLVVVALLSWQLALLALVILPVLLLATVRYGVRLRKEWHDVKRQDSAALTGLQEAFGAVRVVKAFGGEELERAELLAASRRGMHAKLHVAATRAKLDASVAIALAFGTGAVLWVGMQQVTAGALTLGGLLMVLAYLAQIYSPLQSLVGHVAELQSALASADRALALLDESPEVPEAPTALALARADGQIRLENVDFAYEPAKPILADASLCIEAGTRVGIVGETGVGKTTLLSLLTRLYDPHGGRILLDGRDLRDYRLADLRRQFGIVLQDPMLFSRSIAANIAYAMPETTNDQIEAAARLAGAHEFIEALPDGYRTLVGERGMRLSGGERQRISIARAYLRNAPILLMDEPTSSVDVRTEGEIVDALTRLMESRTTIVISHRPSTLLGCDRVWRLSGGTFHEVTGREREAPETDGRA